MNQKIPGVLQRYIAAWEGLRDDTLHTVFTEDARYETRPKALRKPHCGIRAIRRYWRKSVIGEQEKAKVTILRFAVRDRDLWVEWQADTISKMLKGSRSFPLWGVMILELAPDGRIQRLTEYYFSPPAKYSKIVKKCKKRLGAPRTLPEISGKK